MIDRDHAWRRQRELTDIGAILVRPDQHVAWRTGQIGSDPAATLTQVLATILGR